MLVSVDDWLFDVDIEQNMKISSAQADDHCTCGYCRNYYASVDRAYPSLRAFLTNFGVDIEGPDELSPFEPTIYEASYIIHGRVVSRASGCIFVDGIPVKVVSAMEADMDTVRPSPYFVLVVGLMELPWLLDEDPRQVISPANEETYLRRMEKKLLLRLQDETLCS